jgi:3-methyladenine DNA glycosylase Tag
MELLMEKEINRCTRGTNDPDMLKYHDEEWGVHTDNIHLMSEELFASPE